MADASDDPEQQSSLEIGSFDLSYLKDWRGFNYFPVVGQSLFYVVMISGWQVGSGKEA
jgi:hypothetical protein